MTTTRPRVVAPDRGESVAGEGNSSIVDTDRRASPIPPFCSRIEFSRPTPGWRARRWVVEACHSWLNRNRALLIRRSKKEQNHLALLMLASGLIAFKKARLATIAATQPG
jgi:hypothetical protein